MSDLRPVHTDAEKTIDPGNRSKITGAVIVALAVLALGSYGYSQGMFKPLVPFPDSRLPQATLPHNMPKG